MNEYFGTWAENNLQTKNLYGFWDLSVPSLMQVAASLPEGENEGCFDSWKLNVPSQARLRSQREQ